MGWKYRHQHLHTSSKHSVHSTRSGQNGTWTLVHVPPLEGNEVVVRQPAGNPDICQANKILKTSQPATLANMILTRISHTRLTRNNGPYQLGPKPPGIGCTMFTKYQYRANFYANYQDIPLVIKQIKTLSYLRGDSNATFEIMTISPQITTPGQAPRITS